ncbi:hypothetical protein L596_030653 [Steinernema carpocapsae]|uniref:Innexin n=1 Tax=Steinernema carpocapsae TaxID=34508 RepID=A0A4U5LQ08_STECR|nr:hypothetical protein L596_030653 [Steinernema carpocapsae]
MIIFCYRKYRHDLQALWEDSTDRLVNHLTPKILFVVAVTFQFTSWYSRSMTCWSRAEIKAGRRKYIDAYCQANGVFQKIQNDNNPTKVPDLPYYPWIPLMMVVAGLLMRLPKCTCRFFFDHDLHIGTMLGRVARGKKSWTWTAGYFCMKFANVAVLIGILWKFSEILGGEMGGLLWPFQLLLTSEQNPFPSTVFCHVPTRSFAAEQHQAMYNIECYLPLMDMYRYFSIGFYFWNLALLAGSIGNIVMWISWLTKSSRNDFLLVCKKQAIPWKSINLSKLAKRTDMDTMTQLRLLDEQMGFLTLNPIIRSVVEAADAADDFDKENAEDRTEQKDKDVEKDKTSSDATRKSATFTFVV